MKYQSSRWIKTEELLCRTELLPVNLSTTHRSEQCHEYLELCLFTFCFPHSSYWWLTLISMFSVSTHFLSVLFLFHCRAFSSPIFHYLCLSALDFSPSLISYFRWLHLSLSHSLLLLTSRYLEVSLGEGTSLSCSHVRHWAKEN